MENRKYNIPFASRRQIVISIALACLNIVLMGLVDYLFPYVHVGVLVAAFVALYLIEIAVLGLFRERTQEYIPDLGIHDLLAEKGSVILKNSLQPVSVFSCDGVLLWCNNSMLDILSEEDNPVGKSIESLLGESINSDTFGKLPIMINDRLFCFESFVIENDPAENSLYVLALNDVTALSLAQKKYDDSRICVAYIAIDNVEDVLQHVHDKFRSAVSLVDEKLKNWATSMSAIIKSYDNEKYLMLLDSDSLRQCIENHFSIVEDIRQIRVGDGVSITVSIGISSPDGTLAEKDLGARDAIDMALQRGGDHVVYTDETGVHFLGGRTKTIYKKSNVKSRTFTTQLTALMGRADNVIIMGHRFGDFDSFGSSIGIARIAMLCGVKVNIAVDLRDKNLEPLIRIMQRTDDYAQVFVDNADGLDLVGPDTLLVLVDHYEPKRAQFADIAQKVKSLVIVDHHRKGENPLPDGVKAYYIEPTASSACELVTEMLESAVSSQNLLKEEANMLFAGILLDTKQFTRNTGTRTFGAAQYLRGAGANPSDVYSMFKTAPEDLKKEARFHTDIKIYRDNIAISGCEGETDNSYRIIASKAAEKMLTLKGIEAAFTVVKIGDVVHISGRSNGTISVQLILEKLHGGGHFDVAGAQVSAGSIKEVVVMLKSAIDDYLEE